jgi:hypothetical protein
MHGIKSIGLFLIGFLIINPFTMFGQITITSSDLPSSGDTFRFSTTNNPLINTNQTGANQSWNYKTLRPTGQGVDEYKSFIRTPYLFYSQFFGATGLKTADTLNFGILSITNAYTFYRTRTDRYTAEGTGFTTSSIPLASDYSNPDRVYKLPLVFNQHDSDDFRVATTIPTLGSFIQQGKRVNHVDGWGKISTPYKDDLNCLRIKSDILETDSLVTQFVSFGFPANRREIKWLSDLEEQPILQITGALLAGNFTPSQIKYRDSVRSLGPPGGGFGPRVSYTVDRTMGVKNKDTFKFSNATVPNFGWTYAWSFSPSNATFVNGTSSTDEDVEVVFTDSGWYDVKFTVSRFVNSWDTTSNALIRVDNTSDVKDLNKKQLLLLPNPVTEYISVHSNETNQILTSSIYDLQGRLLFTKQIRTDDKIALDFLSKGRYIMVTSDGTDQVRFMFDKI